MKKVAIRITASAKVYAPAKLDNLDEKRIIPNMMVRRRLTRNAKVMLYLADRCGVNSGKVVYGSCYSELEETANIANAVLMKSLPSPISFQNSVYNTAASYFSLIHKDKDEIITVSSGMKTSLDTLKTAALQALISGEKVFCVAVECINIENIDEINRCTDYLEAGAAVVLEIDRDREDAKALEELGIPGVIDSLQDMMSIVNMHEQGIDKILIEL
jgi:hypothetical protein